MAFVAQDAPNLGPNRGVVAPVAPLSSDAFPSSCTLERFQGFPADERAAPHRRYEQKHISSQVGYLSVSRFIQPPASPNCLFIAGLFGIGGGEPIPYSF